MQFVDQCNIYLKAGNGGAGVVAWRREAHYPEGGPWGGDGGKGGDIIICGDQNLNTLLHLRYRKKICANNGQNGQTKLCSGKKGEDIIIKVPLGTQFFDRDSGKLLVDIVNDHQKFVICKGGKGGYGNAHFKSSTNKAPTLYENGDLGEEANVVLKLKHLADVGLIGLPNAGKSSLLTALTKAKPKIANYEFTTLTPILGVLENKKRKIIIADIPGLIKGASENKGLGFQFLQHIERCQLLIHVISLNKADHSKKVYDDFLTIQNELKKYNKQLIDKQQIIVANKIDVDGSDKELEILKEKIKKQSIIAVSAARKDNLTTLKDKIIAICQKQKKKKPTESSTITLQPTKKFDRKFAFKQTSPNEWTITSKYLSYWLHKIPLTTKDNIYRFNQKLNNCNVDQILKDNGAISKDTIIIDGIQFEVD